MGRQLLIGMDLGTSSLKTVLYDACGETVAGATATYSANHPFPAWGQQEANDWWRAAQETIQAVLVEGRKYGDKILGISISSQAPTMLPLDNNGNPLYPAVIWFDKRSEAEANWLREHVGDELVARINGNKIDPYYAGPKMLWFKNKFPGLYSKTYKFLQANGYIVYKLTGKFTVDFCHTSLILLADTEKQTWSIELCERFGIDPDKLPEIYQCQEVVGEVNLQAANETGLDPGIPVFAGGVDTPAAILGDGIYKPGQAYFSMGTGGSIGLCTDHPIQEFRLMSFPHMVAGVWILNGVMTSVGGSLRWFRDQLGGMEREASRLVGVIDYDLLSAEAATSGAGAGNLVFLPYLMGEQAPIWNSKARGMFFGLSLATTRAQMIRAIMEGCGYGLRHNLEVIEERAGKVLSLRLSGGPTRSGVWNQIWADITGLTIEIPESSLGAPIGNAISAGVGIGLYKSFAETLENIENIKTRLEPRSRYKEKYDSLYGVYRRLYQKIHDEFDILSSI
jgi:xylulokinase